MPLATRLLFLAVAGGALACAPVVDGSAPCDATGACGPDAFCHGDGFCWRFAEPDEVCGDVTDDAVAPVDALDLLLVVDDSTSMEEPHAALPAQVERVIRALTSGDFDADGTPDALPFRSVHVGVVTTDMGVGAVAEVEGCSARGDDGVLQRQGPGASCGAVSPIFAFQAGNDVEAGLDGLRCATSVDVVGCGLEQQLEAVLKALAPAPAADGTSPVSWTRDGYVPPQFQRGDAHGGPGGANDGFLREGSMAAVVMLTNEDDCSPLDTGFFDRSDPRYSRADLCCRCDEYPSALYATQRYVEGLIGLRRTPQHVFFGVIAGVPLHVAGLGPATVLNDPEMVVRHEPGLPRHVASCVGVLFRAFPPRRIVEVAGGLASLGASISLQSICDPGLAPAFDDLLATAARLRGGLCIGFAPAGGPEGVACELRETLPVGVQCGDLPFPEARVAERVDEEGRAICLVRQVPEARAGIDLGWTYARDAFDGAGCGPHAEASAMSFTPGAEYELRCTPGDPGGASVVSVGVGCDPESGLVLGTTAACASASLACDVVSRTCERLCASDADCSALGLRCVRQPVEAWCRADLAGPVDRRALRAICH